MLYGRTSYNPLSRFVSEIPDELIDEELAYAPRTDYGRGSYYSSSPRTYISNSQTVPQEPRRRAPEGFGTPATPKAPAKQGLDFKEGDRVFHGTFGAGEILSAKQMGADVLYEVIFDKVGTKKLMGTYARLKKLL